MNDSFDVVVIGMGPGGEVVADRMIDAGRRVAVVERELIGGECAYWACIPSKTLLRPPEARGEARRAYGVAEPALDWAATAAYRDMMVRHLDDGGQKEAYEKRGATVVRGEARIAGPGRVEVGERTLEAEHIVVATGSEAVIPPIEGLDSVTTWTNREATTLAEVPGRAVVVGGGPVGIELGQMMRRFGAEITLVHSNDRLINREEPRVSELIGAALAEDGIDVRLGVHATSARPDGAGAVVSFDDGSEVATDVVVVVTGRTPRVQGLGLETVGVEVGEKSLPIDEGCRLAEGVWAVGDATGVMLFTHLAKYQGRIVAANILGGSRRADYRAIPRVVFSDPEIAAVGLTEAQAREQGIDMVTATVDLGAAIARPITYEEDPRGELGLVADRGRREIVGAWAVAPMASEWIHQAQTSILARIPIDTLLDGVAQFPTYSEAYLEALEGLEL